MVVVSWRGGGRACYFLDPGGWSNCNIYDLDNGVLTRVHNDCSVIVLHNTPENVTGCKPAEYACIDMGYSTKTTTA